MLQNITRVTQFKILSKANQTNISVDYLHRKIRDKHYIQGHRSTVHQRYICKNSGQWKSLLVQLKIPQLFGEERSKNHCDHLLSGRQQQFERKIYLHFPAGGTVLEKQHSNKKYLTIISYSPRCPYINTAEKGSHHFTSWRLQ